MIKFPDKFPCEVWIIPNGGYRPKQVILTELRNFGWSTCLMDGKGRRYSTESLFGSEGEACAESLLICNKKLMLIDKKKAKLTSQVMTLQQTINNHKV